jgi:YhcH/YjgK/YiaL family protein
MILDALSHARAYFSMGPRFQLAFEWLASRDLGSLTLGRIPISGDDVFALPQEVLTKPPANCRWEAHRTYADIQVLVRGTEGMGVAPLAPASGFVEETPYDAQKDVAFYTTSTKGFTVATVRPGWFALFLPHDVHMPLVETGHPEKVFKVVVKVRV